MTGWLIDTNVISELRRPRPDRKVVAFIASQPLDRLHVSRMTLAELRYGVEQVADPLHRADLESWLKHKVRPMFAQRVLEVTEDVILRWRILLEAGRKVRHTYTQPDLFIAATALEHDLTVVTRDTGDFLKANVPVLNPWTDKVA